MANRRSRRPQLPLPSQGESGYTLIELVLAIALMITVLAIPMTLIVHSIYGQDTASSRSVAVRQEEAGFEQLTRDLRQATSATVTSSTGGTSASATLQLPVRVASPSLTSLPSTVQVTWTCTASTTVVGTCTRQPAGGAAAQQIYGVTSACFDTSASNGCTTAVSATNPAYLYLTIRARTVSQRPNAFQSGTAATVDKGGSSAGDVTLSDGVDLRNFS
jgi:type II secretory pathway pseudopilin PulG